MDRLLTSLSIAPADAVSPDSLREAVNACFADHVVPLPLLEQSSWPGFLRLHGISLARSWTLSQAGRVIAFVLLNLRPRQRTRVALMGVVPKERGRGAAARLLNLALTKANARRDQWVELEVFAQNRHATKLSWSLGFKPVCALFGYTTQADSTADPPEGHECPFDAVSLPEAVDWLEELDAHDDSSLPWPISGAAMAARTSAQTDAPSELSRASEWHAWRWERAQLIFEINPRSSVTALSLVDRDAEQTGAAELLRALRLRYPKSPLSTPSVQRKDEAARAFEAVGWQRRPLYQWLLRLPMCG